MTRLDNVEKEHNKKVEKIKYMGNQSNNNSKFGK